MSQDVQLEASQRQDVGKKAVKQLRNAGKVPAVIPKNVVESIHVANEWSCNLKTFTLAGKN